MRYVLGDLHGNFKALKQVLQRSRFDYEHDQLISLGDICDGQPETYECIEELLKIKNLICLRGNHDLEFQGYLETGLHRWNFTQGAAWTAYSYLKRIGKEDFIHSIRENKIITALNPEDVPVSHHRFFESQVDYYIDDDNNCFVHGGFSRHMEFKGQPQYVYLWDRDLWSAALSFKNMNKSLGDRKFKMITPFNKIFIGHTTTMNWDSLQEETRSGIILKINKPITVPMEAANLINLDTGAGGSGKLTLYNLDTGDYFQSDMASDLYPDHPRRW